MELYTGTVPEPAIKNVAMIDGIDGTGFFLTEAAFWVNFLAVICNMVTLVNMLFEAQIVVQMCLEFIDEDDESYKYTDQTAIIPQPAAVQPKKHNNHGNNSNSKSNKNKDDSSSKASDNKVE